MNEEELEKIVNEKVQAEYTKVKQEDEKTKDEQVQSMDLVQKDESNLPANDLKMPNYIPKIDTNKDLDEQASDVVQLMGAQKASQNDDFMGKVADNFANGVLTEQEVKQMKRERLLADEYYIKWEDVLKLVHMQNAQGIGLMKTCVFFMMIPYLILRFIGFCFMCISVVFEFFNTLFNAVFGDGGSILQDKDGKPIIDEKTKKPYRSKSGYNLFAKILLGFIIISTLIALVFLVINVFTGFNIFAWLRSL